jgi:hypothetical protein
LHDLFLKGDCKGKGFFYFRKLFAKFFGTFFSPSLLLLLSSFRKRTANIRQVFELAKPFGNFFHALLFAALFAFGFQRVGVGFFLKKTGLGDVRTADLTQRTQRCTNRSFT